MEHAVSITHTEDGLKNTQIMFVVVKVGIMECVAAAACSLGWVDGHHCIRLQEGSRWRTGLEKKCNVHEANPVFKLDDTKMGFIFF